MGEGSYGKIYADLNDPDIVWKIFIDCLDAFHCGFITALDVITIQVMSICITCQKLSGAEET